MKTYLSSLVPAALWVTAFICALYPINQYQLEFFGAAIALLFLWAYLLLGKGLKTGWEIPKSPVLLIALSFFVVVMASVFWSEVKPISLMGVCFFAVMPLSFLVGVINKDENFFRNVAIALIPVFTVLGAWAIYQFFFMNSYFYGQARHPMGDPSSLGSLLSLALFSALGWILLEQNKLRKTIAIVLAILLCGGIVATAARGPAFAFIPGLIAFTILLLPQIKSRAKSLVLIALGTGVIVALTYVPFVKETNMGTRVIETVTMKGDVTNNRLNIWSGTIDIIKESPWLGKGVSTFFMYYPEHRLPTEIAGTFHAHSDPLQFWVELGILGPVLFYAFILAAAIRTFSALKKLRPDQLRERVIIVTVFSALLALVTGAHVGFSFYNLSILMLTGFLLSVWFHYTRVAVQDETIEATMPEKSPAIVNMAVLAVPFLLLGGMFLGLIAGEHYVNRARDALFKGEMFTFADHINMANKASSGMNTRAYMLAVNVPMAILEDKRKYASKELQTNLYNQVMGYMDTVLRLNPRAGEAYYYKAKMQQMVDTDIVPEGTRPPEELYKEALRLDPMHLGSRLALAGLYSQDKDDKAKKEQVLEGGENFVYTSPLAMQYYQVLATAYLQSGNYVKAQETMKKAVEFKQRSDSSRARLNTTIPEAIANDGNTIDPAAPVTEDPSFPQMPPEPAETSGKKDSGL